MSAWISIRDQSPPADTKVLLWFGAAGKPMWIGYWDEDFCRWMGSDDRVLGRRDSVTHWMPLPEPPK